MAVRRQQHVFRLEVAVHVAGRVDVPVDEHVSQILEASFENACILYARSAHFRNSRRYELLLLTAARPGSPP
jgi:hypothetical protein